MKISVVIPTTNRKDELKYSIEQYFKQTYKNFEIIVIDNASSDGTEEMIKNNFGENEKVIYYKFEENLYFTGFNIGVWRSTGNIIWVCDDDSNPRDNNVFENVVNIFTKFPHIAIIGTEDIEVNQNNKVWDWHPFKVDKENIPVEGYKTFLFHGTGAGIRKEVFNKIGGFWGFGFEELDFTSRAILAGYNARYFPNLVTLHYSSAKMRLKDERWIHMTSQYVKYHFKFFPFWSATFKVSLSLFIELIKAISMGFGFKTILNGILSWKLTAIQTNRKERVIVPKEKIYDITMGISSFKTNIRYLKFMIINKVKKKR